MSPTSPRPGGAARHAACKVHRDSHVIHKQASSPPCSSSSTNSSVSSSSNGATNNRAAPPPPPRQQKQQQQQPVIIYTHSPKVIRTSPHDFMSIVQKLTGLDSPGPAARNAGCSATAVAAAQDESSSSSSESCANAHSHAAAHPYADPRMMPPPPPLDAHFVTSDIPLFAPGPSELQLCVPHGLYDQFPATDAAPLGPVVMPTNNMNGGAAGNGGPVFSPSMVEAMRTFQDY